MQSRRDHLWGRIAVVVATGGGVGFFPVMPGTIGSLWGPPLVWCLQRANLHPALYAGIAVVLVLIGIPICSQAAIRFGRSDPPQVVFDEIAAFPLVFAIVTVDLTTGVLGFFWFRLFDILKPWPVKQLEKLPTGTGIMADDLAAAVYAAIALWGTVQVLN